VLKVLLADPTKVTTKSRPLLRYREEEFGWLAAWPDGTMASLDADAVSLLEQGAAYEDCADHLLSHLVIPVDFHYRAPVMAWIELTKACNLRCPHCFAEAGRAAKNELGGERLLELIDEWAEMGVFSVVLIGGEPSLSPAFHSVFQRAYDHGMVVSISSNGISLNRRLLDKLPRDDVMINFSLDGMHTAGAAGPEVEFERIKTRCLEAVEMGFDVNLMTTTTSTNAGQLMEILSWAIDHDIILRSVPFIPMGHGRSNPQLANSMDDVEPVAQFWVEEERWERERQQRLGLGAGKIFNFLLSTSFSSRRCISGRGITYVDSVGDVYPCSTCSGAKVLAAGNTQFSSFREIWEGDWDIRSITWDNFNENCNGCPINTDDYFCAGRCPANSMILHGEPFKCGNSQFMRASIQRREELFRQQIMVEPRVLVPATQFNSADLTRRT
jgi:radical SAM protein with 4Fe4S-binding SPASM domain